MDTQGMSMPGTGRVDKDAVYPVYIPKKLTVFTDKEREELKQMVREVLDEYI